jgi:hypothetical protein
MGVCRRAVTAENMRRYLEIFRNTFILLGYLRYSGYIEYKLDIKVVFRIKVI